MKKKHKELAASELRNIFASDEFSFRTTEELNSLQGIIGQSKAVNAMDFGLRVRKHGYNIFITGLTGTGRSSYAKSVVSEHAQRGTTPVDWCYVYNFAEPEKPRAISLAPGQGQEFAKDMDGFIDKIKQEIPKALASEDYEDARAQLFNEYKKTTANLMQELKEMANSYNFRLEQTSEGLATIPLKDGRKMTAEDFDQLSTDERREIEQRSEELNEKTYDVFREMKQLEEEMKSELETLNQKVGYSAIHFYVQELLDKYAENPDILEYLNELKDDLQKNIHKFSDGGSNEKQTTLNKMPVKNDPALNYQVNLLVSNAKTEGAPVVYETNPTYYNLLGRIEYKNMMGLLTTDYTRIKPGALHKANGGFLIVQAKDLLSNPHAWRGLKRALKNDCLAIENVGQESGYAVTSTLRPEEIPLDVKVVIIGNSYLYHTLYQVDEDFRKLFKIVSQFDIEMDRTQENINKLARFIKTHCDREQLKHFSSAAVAKIVEYSSRLSDDQSKLSTRFSEIVEVLYEADAWAQMEDSELVTVRHVEKAIHEKKERSNLYENKIFETISDGTVLIKTKGAVEGQINGLAVIKSGNHTFGKPVRITVTTYAGRDNIVNIEREIKHSGSIHDKGVLTLAGYLGEKFAQEIPLSLSATINFEQLYSGIDGDSASSTELYALLSSLADLPINQGIAVTGSVNQWGEIQPIGGVNEKIEGFYRVCQLQGLSGEQGVIIPHQNVKNLMLNDVVVDAVERGEFHIYPIKSIEEGIEILTGTPAGVLNSDGSYLEDTVFHRVKQQLRRYAEISKKWNLS